MEFRWYKKISKHKNRERLNSKHKNRERLNSLSLS